MLLRGLRAGWGLGKYARAVMLTVATAIVLAVCWYVVLPIAGAVMVALWHVAALLTAMGVAVKVVAWAMGAPAVAASARQLGMVLVVCWLASVVAAGCTPTG